MPAALTEQQAWNLLRQAVDQAGGVCKLAKIVGISSPAISRSLHGHTPIRHTPIHGKLAKHLGLKVKRHVTITYEKRKG